MKHTTGTLQSRVLETNCITFSVAGKYIETEKLQEHRIAGPAVLLFISYTLYIFLNFISYN